MWVSMGKYRYETSMHDLSGSACKEPIATSLDVFQITPFFACSAFSSCFYLAFKYCPSLGEPNKLEGNCSHPMGIQNSCVGIMEILVKIFGFSSRCMQINWLPLAKYFVGIRIHLPNQKSRCREKARSRIPWPDRSQSRVLKKFWVPSPYFPPIICCLDFVYPA